MSGCATSGGPSTTLSSSCRTVTRGTTPLSPARWGCSPATVFSRYLPSVGTVGHLPGSSLSGRSSGSSISPNRVPAAASPLRVPPRAVDAAAGVEAGEESEERPVDGDGHADRGRGAHHG